MTPRKKNAMYVYNAAPGQIGQAPPPPAQKQEQVSDILETAYSSLSESRASLDVLIQKYLGPRPTENAKAPEPPQRSLRGDADNLRHLAHSIMQQVHELHGILGY